MIAYILGLIAKAALLLPALAALNSLLMAVGEMADAVAKLLGKPDSHPLAKPIAKICAVIKWIIDLISGNMKHG